MSATDTSALPDYAVPRSAMGPALNEQGYHVGRVERNLYRVTDGVYKAAVVKGYLDTASHLAAQRVIEKYTGLPGAADVFTDDVAFRRWIRRSWRRCGAGRRRPYRDRAMDRDVPCIPGTRIACGRGLVTVSTRTSNRPRR
jgi:hypothetical protein